jgi:uncharacterized protein (DUF927 family)
MNERIVKLSTEAENYACTVAEKYVPECGEISYLWEHAFRKKFAELIVKECMTIGFNTVYKVDDDRDAVAVYQNIKEHFGVEKE